MKKIVSLFQRNYDTDRLVSILLAALIAALVPGVAAAAAKPTPAPEAGATFPPAALAVYTAIPCAELIHKSGLDGKPITADALGMILATALREHGFEQGKISDKTTIGKSITDFVGCFQTAASPEPKKK